MKDKQVEDWKDDPREEFLNDPRARMVDEPPEIQSPEQLRKSWTAVSTGLRWYFVTSLVKVGVLVVAGVGGAMLAADITAESLDGVMTFFMIAVLCSLAVDVFGLVLLTRIARVPAVSGARGRAWAAFITGAIVLGLKLVMAMPMIVRDLDAMGEDSGLETASRSGSIIMVLFLVASLRSLADHLGRPEVEALGGRVMTLIGIMVGTAVFGFLIAGMAGSGPLAIVFMVAFLGLAVWAFVLFLMMLHKLARHTKGEAKGEADVASAF